MKARLLPLVVFVLSAACSEPSSVLEPPADTPGPTVPPAPTAEMVAGSYKVTSFTTQEAGTTTDRLAEGAVFDIALAMGAATTGHLFVPEGGEHGEDFEADLAGTWTLRRDTVEFDHTADTFVRDMPFVYASNKLTGGRTFGTVTVQVVLTKQ